MTGTTSPAVPSLSADGLTLTVRVPLAVRRRAGRKRIVVPEGATWAPPRARIDSSMVKALARAHRWKRMLESARFATMAELAAAERINESYLSRVLRLTLLAPDIVEAILDGRQGERVTLAGLFRPFPVEWEVQTAAGTFA
jgi:hypothetical protein